MAAGHMKLLTAWQVPHLNRNPHERPAIGADVALLAACPHVIIIRQIYVKHKLPLRWEETGCIWMGGIM